MRLDLSPRTQALIVLMLVALSGLLAGVLVERLVAQQRAPGMGVAGESMRAGPDARARSMGPGARMRAPAAAEMRYAERLSTLIDLTPEQRVAIDSIMTEERRRVRELTEQVQPRFREIARRTRERVDAVLTAEQQEAMRALRRQRMRPGG